MSAAAAWTGLVRATDTIARMGGDEFAVVLPECPQERAIHTANQLREAVPADGGGCSAGVATWDFTETPGHLLHRADQALYVAKGGGGQRTGVADWTPTTAPPATTPPSANA
jgi:diguanylate cyclase (GGDEF)-like protein